VGTVNGVASTTLNSGTIPGTATITATVQGTNLSSSSGVIAIGGGIPSEGHFSLSTETFNLEGFNFDGITTEITARIADRYGNYNVLAGTSVSFYSECGAIDRAINLSSEGEGSVVFRTQNPDPEDVTMSPYDDVIAANYQDLLGITITDDNNPRNGLCTIIAVVDGEEEFTDANADGVYNLGESYVDTYNDIHLDKDDDSQTIPFGNEVPGNPYDSTFEDLVVDRDQDGVFDGMNNVWDRNKRISDQIKLLYTGIPSVSVADSNGTPVSELGTITVPNGESKTVYFSIHDINYNPPIAGTSFSVSLDIEGGELAGKDEHTYLDTNSPGAPIFSVVISDSDPDDGETAKLGILEITWNWKGNEYSYSVFVSVD
jgi:hypothetical protein